MCISRVWVVGGGVRFYLSHRSTVNLGWLLPCHSPGERARAFVWVENLKGSSSKIKSRQRSGDWGVCQGGLPSCVRWKKGMKLFVVLMLLWLQQNLLFSWPLVPAHEMTPPWPDLLAEEAWAKAQLGLPQKLGRRKYDTLPENWASLPLLPLRGFQNLSSGKGTD